MAVCSLPSHSAQFANAVLTVEPPAKAVLKAGGSVSVKITAKLANGFHANTNAPEDEYLIPMKLTWDAAPLVADSVDYPKGKTEKYEFSAKPISVYTGTIEITSKLRAPADAAKGAKSVAGKLRYQACTPTTCYQPKTVVFQMPVEIQ